MNIDTLHVYWDKGKRYRWTFISDNGRIIADSGQGYVDRRDALHGFAILNRAQVTGPALYELERCERHGDLKVCLVWQLTRRDLEHVVADTFRDLSMKCPLHGDRCGPGAPGIQTLSEQTCRLPEYLRNQLDRLAQDHDSRSLTR